MKEENLEKIKQLNVDGLNKEKENLKKALADQKTEFEKISK